MKIAFASDLHLEFGGADFDLPDADVLLLAGDICVIEYLKNKDSRQYNDCVEFFKAVSAKYEHVLWIPGNHEFYGGVMGYQSRDIVFKFLEELKITNVNYNECGSSIFSIGYAVFVTATLWTDFKGASPLIMNNAQHGMNDYRRIMIADQTFDSGVRYITAKDIHNVNTMHNTYIKKTIDYMARNGIFNKFVVMTHHAPNVKSASTNKPSELDYAYCCSNLDDFILDNPQIKYWIHGHTHNNSNYMIGETNVLSNCRGYVGYEATNNFKIKVIEV